MTQLTKLRASHVEEESSPGRERVGYDCTQAHIQNKKVKAQTYNPNINEANKYLLHYRYISLADLLFNKAGIKHISIFYRD